MTTLLSHAPARSTETGAAISGYEALSTSLPLTVLPTVAWRIVAAYEQRHGTYGLLVYESQTGAVQMFLTTEAELDSICALIEWCITIGSYWPACEACIEEWRNLWQLTKDVYDQVHLREAVLS